MPARSRIDVLTDGGGRRLIRVADDGEGMIAADLALAVERHATSKLADDDLVSIRTLGFRGEALPSIGAVARLAIATRHASRAARLVDRGRRRREVGRKAGGARGGHAGRGARPVLRHAGAAEVPQARPHRGGGGARGGAPARHEPAGCRLHARRRGARAGDIRGDAARRHRPARRGSATCSAPTSAPTRSRSLPNAKA